MKTDPPIFYKPPTRFVEAKTDSPNFYKLPMRFAEVKTDSPNSYVWRLYRCLVTSFVAVKTDSPNAYKPPTRFTVDKMHSTNPYNLYTHLSVDKTDSLILNKISATFFCFSITILQ